MEKLINRITVLILLIGFDSYGQDLRVDSNLYAKVYQEVSPNCQYDKGDSVMIVFQKGFEGHVQVFSNDSLAHTVNAKFISSTEMSSGFLKLKYIPDSTIKLKYGDEELNFLVNRNFGILLVNRRNNKDVVWDLHFSNCNHLARR